MKRRKLLQMGMVTAAATLTPNVLTASLQHIQFPGNNFNRIRLNANENVYGPSQSARQAINNAISTANRYPSAYALPQLKKSIAKYHNIDESMVLITAGSLQALRILGQWFGTKKGNHIAPDLSFTPLMRQAEFMGCRWKKVPVNNTKAIDLSAIKNAIESDTRFVYVTNPNNPTGSYIDHKEVKSFCRDVSKQVPTIIDEAYIEFVTGDESPSLTPLLHNNPNLIITRTFSKIHGLAGLRIGYILAKESWINEWNKWDQNASLGVSNISAMAADASLRDRQFVKESKRKIDSTRERFVQTLTDLGIRVYPSKTNFILVQSHLFEKSLIPLLDENQIDMAIGRSGAMSGLARISIGTDKEMDLLGELITKSI